MAYLSKEDQAINSKAWYERHKALVLERKASRAWGDKKRHPYVSPYSKYRRLEEAVRAASLDRWISGKEGLEIAYAEAVKAGEFLDPERAAQAVIARMDGAAEVGLIAGDVAFERDTDAFKDFVEVLAKPYRKHIPIELFILNLTAKQMKGATKWTQLN